MSDIVSDPMIDDDSVEPTPPSRAHKLARIGVIVGIAVIVPLLVLFGVSVGTRGKDIGDACTKAGDCESRECLSADAYKPTPKHLDDGSYMMRAPGPIATGACSRACVVDSDCPASMMCGAATLTDVMTKSQWDVRRCMPRAWGSLEQTSSR